MAIVDMWHDVMQVWHDVMKCVCMVKCVGMCIVQVHKCMWSAGMSINFRPGKSGTSAWPFLAKVMPNFSVNFFFVTN